MQAYSTKGNKKIGALMLFTAGFVDLSAFILGGHLILVFMGGNITSLSYGLFTFNLHDILKFGGIIVTFAFGSFIGALFYEKLNKLSSFFLIEIVLAFIALTVTFFGEWYCFLVLCFMIGYQNALKIKVKDITISESFITSSISGFGYYLARNIIKKEDITNYLMILFKIGFLFLGDFVAFILLFFTSFKIQHMILIIIVLYFVLFLYAKHIMRESVV